MTVGITPVASADYYLRSCSVWNAEQSHGPAGPAEYELEAIALLGEPLGYWWHPGANLLGLEGDIDPHAPSGDAFRTLVNEARDPTRPKVWEVDPSMAAGGAWRHPLLGSDLRHFRTTDEWMADWDDAHPDATPEERRDEVIKAEQQKRANRTAYDVTFSLPKSWSVLHAALQREGRHDDAEQLMTAFRIGMEASLRQAADEFGMTRRGVSGPKIEREATTTHERTPDLVSAVFMHHTSRDGEPQLHAHVMVLNRVLCGDGVWRALHALPLMRSKHQLDATMLRVAEGEATRRLGLYFAAGADDKAREIVGVSREVRDLFSSRSRALGAEAQELEDAYRAKYPKRKLRPLVRWRMNQRANKKSRKAKPDEAPTREEALADWEARTARAFREGFRGTVEAVDAARALPGDPIVVEPLDEEAVKAMAIADVEGRKANWYRSHLYKAISDRMPDVLAIEPARAPELITRLTDEALASREVVTISTPAVPTPPASLMDEVTGRTVFDMGHKIRYTTAKHLEREDSLVARLDQRGAVALTEGEARGVLAGRGLSDDQLELAVAILTSDRWMEVVDAAAGVGKSRVMAVLSDVSQEVWGRGVVGFTTAENAAQVLAAEGVETAHNIAAYLDFHQRSREGRVSYAERALMTLRRGATVVVDEASMVDTVTLQALVNAVEEAGAGRVVLIGDTEQVDAVDAGGVFALLAEQGQTRTLETVRRFTHQWERDASIEIRAGNVSALAHYEAHARIHGDIDVDKVRDAAVRAFVGDYVAGRDTVLVTSTSDAAADVSSRARKLLVQAGVVEAAGVDLHDRTVAGIGDLVQTRHNRRDLGDAGVFNRQIWEVVGTTSGGGLLIRRAQDRRIPTSRQAATGLAAAPQRAAVEPSPTVELPADYVAEKVELAYAGAVEAVQGRTTDTAHLLVDRTMGRSRAYPGWTRGRDGNWAWVELESHRNELGQIVADETPVGRMADVIGDDDHVQAARTAITRQLDRAVNLGHLGPEWQVLVSAQRDVAHRATIREVLEPVDAGAVLADAKARDVLQVLRTAETDGRDSRQVLEAAARGGSVWSADSPAAALRSRIDVALKAAPRDPSRVAATYVDRTPAGSDKRMVWAREIAAAMDARVTALGGRVAGEAPEWAVEQFGSIPVNVVERLEWEAKAGVVEAYREQFGWAGRHSAIGPRPSRHEPERLWVWSRAADVLEMDAHARDLSAASDGELALRVQRWERALAEMPRNVDADLREAWELRLEASGRVVDAYEAGEDTVDDELDLADVEQRVETLDEIAEIRTQLYDASEEVRVRAQDARGEQRRREDAERDRTGQAHRDDPGAVEPDEPDEPEDDPARVAEPAFDDAALGDRDPEVDVEALAATFDRIATVAERVADREVPAFGTREWLELADDDPAKGAAVTDAARRGWNVGEPLDRDAAEVSERLAEHEPAEVWVGDAGYRVVDRPEGDREPERDLEVTWSYAVPVEPVPEVDVEVLAAVHAWSQPHLEGDAPTWGSRAWAELPDDDPQREKAEARAALTVWNLGDDLEARRERLAAQEQVEVSHAVSQAQVAQREAERERLTAERTRVGVEERRAEAARVRELEQRSTPEVSDEEHALSQLFSAEQHYRDPEASDAAREVARIYLESQGVDVDEPEREQAEPVADAVWPEVAPIPEPEPEPEREPDPEPEPEPVSGSDEVRRYLVREAHAEEARRAEAAQREAEEEAARDAAERQQPAHEDAEPVRGDDDADPGIPAPRDPDPAENPSREPDPAEEAARARAERDAEIAQQLQTARAAAAAIEAQRDEQADRQREVDEQQAREQREANVPVRETDGPER